MKGIATMLFGIAMILLAILSAIIFFAGESYFFVALLAITAFVGFFAVLCGLAQVYERPKKKDNGEVTDEKDTVLETDAEKEKRE